MSSPHAAVSAPSETAAAASGTPADRDSQAAGSVRHAHDTGLLVLRIAVGLTVASHGTQKLFGWFHGMGLDGTGQFFQSAGYPSGKVMAAVAGLCETLGGLGLVLGLLTPLAGSALFGTMLNALAVKWGGGFFAPKGVEFELLLTASTAALALTGPGRFAVDRLLPVLRTHRLRHGVGAVVLGAVVAAVVLLLVRD